MATTSAVLDGFRLEIDQNLKQRRILTFEPGKIILAGSKLHLPHGARLNRGEWEREARRFAQSSAAAGEVLAFVNHPTGNVARPTLCKELPMQALLWFHEACREEIDAMAVVKFTLRLMRWPAEKASQQFVKCCLRDWDGRMETQSATPPYHRPSHVFTVKGAVAPFMAQIISYQLISQK